MNYGDKPIGILDSGLGGLTIWKEIDTLLPTESFIYLGDSLNAPYGERSSEEIYSLAKQMVTFLVSKQVKLVVIACNTITVSCLDKLRVDFPQLSFVGTVPAIKTAVSRTQAKRIGLLSTKQTAKSAYNQSLIAEFAADCSILNEGTNELVPLIERGEFSSSRMHTTLQSVLLPFQEAQIDTLVLGCTHFPLLRQQISEILGDSVQIIDSGSAIALQVQRVLQEKALVSNTSIVTRRFYTTGNKDFANAVLQATIAGERFGELRGSLLFETINI